MQVEWDPMSDVDGYDESSILDVVLLPMKWKNDVAMAWRMDIEVNRYERGGIISEEGSEIDIESEEDDDMEVGSGSELESESVEISDEEEDIMSD